MRPWMIALGLLMVGCGSDSEPAASLDTGVDDSAVVDTGATDDTGAAADTSTLGDTGAAADTGSKADAATACNTIDNVADVITTQQVAEALPTFAGGAVPEGTYVITAITTYTGVGGATGPKTGTTMKQTMRLAGGKFDIVRSQNGAAEKRSSGDFSTAGSTFTLGSKCPSAVGDVPFNYESSGGVLKLSLGTTIKDVLTYTKK